MCMSVAWASLLYVLLLRAYSQLKMSCHADALIVIPTNPVLESKPSRPPIQTTLNPTSASTSPLLASADSSTNTYTSSAVALSKWVRGTCKTSDSSSRTIPSECIREKRGNKPQTNYSTSLVSLILSYLMIAILTSGCSPVGSVKVQVGKEEPKASYEGCPRPCCRNRRRTTVS
jgi:hypothetical protein